MRRGTLFISLERRRNTNHRPDNWTGMRLTKKKICVSQHKIGLDLRCCCMYVREKKIILNLFFHLVFIPDKRQMNVVAGVRCC